MIYLYNRYIGTYSTCADKMLISSLYSHKYFFPLVINHPVPSSGSFVADLCSRYDRFNRRLAASLPSATHQQEPGAARPEVTGVTPPFVQSFCSGH